MKRSAMLMLLALMVVSAAAWAVDEEINYTGDCVSLGNTTKLCAKALTSTGDGFVGVPNIDVWFQAWNFAGIPRFPGPSSTLPTNSVGDVCTLKTLNTGLYTVQAFGATDVFENVSSVPRVIGSLIPRNGSSGAATAGVCTAQEMQSMESRDIAIGALLLVPDTFSTVAGRVYGPQYHGLVKQPSMPAILEQFLLLDPDNPNGLTTIKATRLFSAAFSVGTSGPYGQASTFLTGFCDVQAGDRLFRAYMNVEIRIDQGLLTPRMLIDRNCVDGTGDYFIQVRRLNGQVFMDLSGKFDGCSCLFINPPPP